MNNRQLPDELVVDIPKPAEAPKPADNNPTGPRPVRELATKAFETFKRRANGEEKAIPTPWQSVNNAMCGGLWPALYMLASGSGVGKSQWALQVALEAAKHEQRRERAEGEAVRPVVYVALELGELDVVARLAGLVGKVKWSDVFFGKSKESVEGAIADLVKAGVDNWPLEVEVAPPNGWSADRLWALVKERKPSLVVIDYLQLVAPAENERYADLRQSIGRIAYAGRAIARDENCAVLVLSSVSRAHYKTTSGSEDVNPGTSDPAGLIGVGKESGEIEYSADVVLALVQEPYEKGKTGRAIHLAIAKQRGAPATWVPLTFDGNRFVEPETKGSCRDF